MTELSNQNGYLRDKSHHGTVSILNNAFAIDARQTKSVRLKDGLYRLLIAIIFFSVLTVAVLNAIASISLFISMPTIVRSHI